MEETLPLLLKQWRSRRGMTLGALAIKSGVHIATLSRWESGRQPRWTEFESVLDALMVPCREREALFKQLDKPAMLRLIKHPTGQLPPLRGDLLRAMRLRKGYTQSQVAGPLNITQGMLAKWEKSEDWPSAERISALCFLLDAGEAELTALLCNRFDPEPVREDLTWEEMDLRMGELLFNSPLADLGFLALEERLWWQTARRETDRPLLDFTYACHARYLSEDGRFAEAKTYLERSPLRYRDRRYETIELNHILARSAVVRQGGTRPHPERGVDLLLPHLDQTRRHAFKAWMQSEVAKCLLEMGSIESALCFSEEAIQTAGRCPRTCEVWFRILDHATILNRLGRWRDAFEMVERIAEEPDFQPAGLAIALTLVGTRALLQLHQDDRAQQWLRKARQKLEVTPAYLIRPALPLQAARLEQELSAGGHPSDG